MPKLYVSKARPKVLAFLRLNYLLVGSEWQKQCSSSIAFTLISVYRLDNRCRKCKKTKAFGLVLLFHLQDRVAHFVRNPALSTDQPLRGSWHNEFLLSRTRVKYYAHRHAFVCVTSPHLYVRYNILLVTPNS